MEKIKKEENKNFDFFHKWILTVYLWKFRILDIYFVKITQKDTSGDLREI